MKSLARAVLDQGHVCLEACDNWRDIVLACQAEGCLYSLKMSFEALIWCDEAVRNQPRGWAYLANVFSLRGEHAASVRCLARARELAGDDHRVERAYVRSRNALAWSTRLHLTQTADEIVDRSLFAMKCQDHEFDDARNLVRQRLLSEGCRPEHWLDLAFVYESSQDFVSEWWCVKTLLVGAVDTPARLAAWKEFRRLAVDPPCRPNTILDPPVTWDEVALVLGCEDLLTGQQPVPPGVSLYDAGLWPEELNTAAPEELFEAVDLCIDL